MNSHPQPPPFDWTLMRSFIAVIEEGSLQAAARRLHSSQPTVGRHIATLEQQLGSQLFDRRARQLVPTNLALSIASHARQMEANADAIRRALVAQNDNTIAQVRISASQCTSCYLLPPILKVLQKQEPGLAIELVSSNHFVNLQRLEADIAVRMARPQEECLVARRLGVVHIGAYAHKSYLARWGIPKVAQDLIGHDLIGYDNQQTILRGLTAWGVPADKAMFNLRTDDHMVVWQALRQSMGIGFTAHYVARRDPDVVQVLAELPIAPLEVWLTLHEDLRLNPGIRRVFDCLAESLIQRLAAEVSLDENENRLGQTRMADNKLEKNGPDPKSQAEKTMTDQNRQETTLYSRPKRNQKSTTLKTRATKRQAITDEMVDQNESWRKQGELAGANPLTF